MSKGKLIVIEGACDGIGKSTQFELLKKRLATEGAKVVSHHFPSYNTYHGAPVEEFLKGTFGLPNTLSPYFINSLFAVDRIITWKTSLKPAYDKGSMILLDRYTTSTLFYQSALIDDLSEKLEFINYVTDFEYNKLELQKPDKVIFLNAPYDLITELRNNRKNADGIAKDVHERNDDFLRRTYNGAQFVAKQQNWTFVECCKNGKFRSIEEIHEDIYSKIKS